MLKSSSKGDIYSYRCAAMESHAGTSADVVTTEIIRHSLNSAANQMKRVLCRTAFSPLIYEVLDFAVAIYDRHFRLLAQAPSLPLFMGTLNFCVEAAVESIRPDVLASGDIVLFNDPFGTGSHQQDMALVMPVFLESDALIGYAVIKAHWLDIAGKDPYCTDTIDYFQEGTIYPGVKLVKQGQLVMPIYRIIVANSRVPVAISGDMKAQCAGVQAGAAALRAIVDRYGREVFEACVERMFDHGEAVVRKYFETIPDGQYIGTGGLDNDGLDDEPVEFDVIVEIKGSNVRIDYSQVPDARRGPINCPHPSTVSASRVALTMLAGGGEAPTEGHFRPIEVVTRKGSMFHPLAPSPCFLYGWPAFQAIDAIYRAIGTAVPEAVPADSAGDLAGGVWWGVREKTGEPWADGGPHPIGQGAHAAGDGSTCIHIGESATRFLPTEIREARYPWMVEKIELAQDSCGAGKYRGGMGVDMVFRALEDLYITPTVDRTKTAPKGLAGGLCGRANAALARFPNGTVRQLGKATRVFLPKGTVFEFRTGGGGGYGRPEERATAAVGADLKDGYISADFARKHYPHVREK